MINKNMKLWNTIKELSRSKLAGTPIHHLIRNKHGDYIRIGDEVSIWNGKKLVSNQKGHFVNYGLITLVNSITLSIATSAVFMIEGTESTNWKMRVGIGAGTTSASTTGLSSETAVAPSSVSRTQTTPSAGTHRSTISCTWNTGTLGAITVSEIGLWGRLTQTIASTTQTSLSLMSRLSNADGDFVSLVVDPSVPFVIEWRINLSYA